MEERKFKNELGNSIVVKVKSAASEKATKDGKPIRVPCVNISIAGPTSISENVVTLEEARKIRDALAAWLNKL